MSENPTRPEGKSGPRRPNVVLVVLDDVGFAEFGCFGSSIATPTIDAIAAGGVLYSNFHVTPMCSPSRACFMTGRNAHAVGMGRIVEAASDGPGYSSRIPRSAAMVSRHLRDAGYATFAVGKWHLAPHSDCTPAGPFDRWPLGQGFDRFYGFLEHSTDQWHPQLVRDNSFVGQPSSPDEGYHLSSDLASEAIDMISSQKAADPDRPFFLYLATGAMHFPHQAPQSYVDAYRGAFDHGWDAERDRRFERQVSAGVVPEGTVNTERPPWIPAWTDYPERDRRILARQMELYAGYLTHTDEQIGRVVEHLRRTGQWENTVIMVTSDNGASGEGGDGWPALPAEGEPMPDLDAFGGVGSYHHYASGWAWAAVTPLRYWKMFSWLGGVRTPFVARVPDPAAVGPGGVRPQFAHAIDVAPTILELAGVVPRDEVDGIGQQRFDGVSLVPTLASADAGEVRTRQYFEMWGSRSIYADGWKATTSDALAWHGRALWRKEADPEDAAWQLFRLTDDFSESRDLAAEEPERLAELLRIWDEEATRNHVLPFFATVVRNELVLPPEPFSTWPRTRYVGAPASSPLEIPDPLGTERCRITVDFADAPAELPHPNGTTVFAIHQRIAGALFAPRWRLGFEDGSLTASATGGDGEVRVSLSLAECGPAVTAEFVRRGPDRGEFLLRSGGVERGTKVPLSPPSEGDGSAQLFIGRSHDGRDRIDSRAIGAVTVAFGDEGV